MIVFKATNRVRQMSTYGAQGQAPLHLFRSLFIWVIQLACMLLSFGCERFAYKYDYSGILVDENRLPVAEAKVSAQPSSRPFEFHLQDRGWIDIREFQSTFTDAQGRFHHIVNGNSTYLQCLGLPPAEAPKLDGMLVWIYSKAEMTWRSVYVPLMNSSSQRGYPGGQRLDLGTIILPKRAVSGNETERVPLIIPTNAK